jgi:F-type H+-transporting ATPase subunit b
MLETAEFWVAVGFVILVAGIWRPVARQMTNALDARGERIRASLDEARSLAEEAQHLLAEHQRRQRDAGREVERLVAHAREEAERNVAESRTRIEAALRRRVQLAREKIAIAEADAVREVREVAVEIAVATTRALIARHLDAAASRRLIDGAIEELPARLH